MLPIVAGYGSGSVNLACVSTVAIGGNVTPEEVTVSNVKRGAMSVRWLATTAKGRYSCSADDMVRRPYCVKQ